MGILGREQNIVSPIQEHKVYLANDVQWITGDLKSLGNPHNYINQDDLDFFNVAHPQFSPWSFTGLPNSHASLTMVNKTNVQFLMFPDPVTMETFRPPLRTSLIMLTFPLAIIHGEIPFLSEATIENFLDFWKGVYLPILNAKIHYLTECAIRMPSEAAVMYINRNQILSYISG